MVEKKRSGRLLPKKIKKELSSEYESGKPGDSEESSNPYEGMPDYRTNVGARNPYIIAKWKLESADKKSPFLNPDYFEKVRVDPKYLKKIMVEAFDFPFEKMFDPKYGSPVYYGIFFATLKAAASCPKKYAPSLNLFRQDPARRTGEIPEVICSGIVKSANPTDTIGGKPLKYRNTYQVKGNSGRECNDPVQGCVADCWFISALSSVAYAATNTFRPNLTDTTVLPPPLPNLNFYPPCIWNNPATITASAEFYTDSAGMTPFFARTNNTMRQYEPNYYECWTSYYEKCYAGYWQKNRIPDHYNPPVFDPVDDPDYRELDFGNSFEATKDLTGKSLTIKDTVNYIDTIGSADLNDCIVSHILSFACGGGTLANGRFFPTKGPATAYTYASDGDVPAAANQSRFKDQAGNISHVTYAPQAGLPANHSFSILGVYQANGKKYVVLRNPWGFAGKSSFFNTYCQYYHAEIPATKLTKATYIPNPALEGIFCLQSLCFMRYFESFGWAPPT